jgi:CheY-like chemotaxis protein
VPIDLQATKFAFLFVLLWPRSVPTLTKSAALVQWLDFERVEMDRERCLEAGMDGYVSKPIRVEALIEAIHSVMHPHTA